MMVLVKAAVLLVRSASPGVTAVTVTRLVWLSVAAALIQASVAIVTACPGARSPNVQVKTCAVPRQVPTVLEIARWPGPIETWRSCGVASPSPVKTAWYWK